MTVDPRAAAPNGPRRSARRRRTASRVWVYVVDGSNTADLRQLDSVGVDTWRANRGTRRGDLVLMYRTTPYRDLAYTFRAQSDAREQAPRRALPWRHVVDLGDGFRFPQTIPFAKLAASRPLRKWSFVKFPRGVMNRSKDVVAERCWPALRHLLVAEGRVPPERLRLARRRRPQAFVSYVSEDRDIARWLCARLRHGGLDPWLDSDRLRSGARWRRAILAALRGSDAVIPCLTRRYVANRGFARRELAEAMRLERRRPGFVLPVMLEPCSIPRAIRDLHVARRSEPRALLRLITSVVPPSRESGQAPVG